MPSSNSNQERSVNRRAAFAAAAVAMLVIAASGRPAAAYEPDFRANFARVDVGMTLDMAIALMSTPPTSTESDSKLGIPSATLRWKSATGTTYRIDFIFDRVVGMTSCDRRGNC